MNKETATQLRMKVATYDSLVAKIADLRATIKDWMEQPLTIDRGSVIWRIEDSGCNRISTGQRHENAVRVLREEICAEFQQELAKCEKRLEELQ